ncbi:AAA family ATPase [Mesomycoplasma molare]|uniref:AAA family ATPase n=1 Tax=Mesomycoplasma molare TaxID=171288 RepID=A0ABY5TY89_9BACT|nr:AAA family ATPase [Mesomycoplasma molare]UWD34491.1 AAA family ATPase [Mesomycoplasma molare]
MKVITFSNNKGGVLKTSLTVNYAGVLSKKVIKF